MNFLKKKLFSGNGAPTTITAGTPETGITASDYVNGRDIVTVLTFTNLLLGAGGAGNRAYGKIMYTFPNGSHIHIATYMDVNVICSGADSTDVGVGSVIGAGAVATLDGTATFEDYITGQTVVSAASPGTNVKKMTVATAGVLTGISINEASGTKRVHLNIAGNWTGAMAPDREVYATGTIVLKWVKMS